MTDAALALEDRPGTLQEPLAPAAVAEEEACELRVLAGRAAGAKIRLEPGTAVELGYAFASDVVIRDPAAKGLRLRLKPGFSSAELELIEGEVELLGHRLGAPATALLPPYVPLLIGDSAVAFGDPEGRRWPEAERLLLAARPALPAPDDGEATAEDARLPPWRMLTGLKAPRIPHLLPIVAAVLICAGSAVGYRAAQPLLHAPPSAEKATEMLRKHGFPTVRVERGDDGALVARGILPREADRARLDELARAKSIPMTLEVVTADGVARGVEDVFRTSGFEAVAKSAGLGVVRVAVAGGDAARLEDARRAALRDVKGLRVVEVLPKEGATLGTAANVSSDPGKRVTAVVGGEVAYVVTADNSRYFVGATLPTGHKIVSIADQDVSVEKDGLITHLKF